MVPFLISECLPSSLRGRYYPPPPAHPRLNQHTPSTRHPSHCRPAGVRGEHSNLVVFGICAAFPLYALQLLQPAGGSRDLLHPQPAGCCSVCRETSWASWDEVREKGERYRDPLAVTLSGCKRWQPKCVWF